MEDTDLIINKYFNSSKNTTSNIIKNHFHIEISQMVHHDKTE